MSGDKIYGITESGYLAYYDSDFGGWIIRGKGGVFSSKTASAMRKEIEPFVPRGKYGQPDKVIETKKPRKWIMVTPVNVSFAIALLALVLWWFAK